MEALTSAEAEKLLLEYHNPLMIPLDGIAWSVRVQNALKWENINFVYQLIEREPLDFIRLPNFGRKSLREVQEALAHFNLKLGQKNKFCLSVSDQNFVAGDFT
jgi:DNA-directed RNA polymerase alpha subunit